MRTLTRLFFPLLAAALLAGCSNTVPHRSQPGATLVGEDLPPVMPLAQASGETTPPQPLKMINPLYPAELRKSGLSGKVVVEFIVDTRGDVVEAQAVSAPHPAMAREAEAAVRQFKFRPGMRNGKPLNAKLRVPFTFRIDNVPASADPGT